MTKRASEGELGAALRQIDGLRTSVLRLPDPKVGAGVSNWKPCDFVVWTAPRDLVAFTSWWEAKDTDQVARFPFADMRKGQLAGIPEAARMGIPYWLAIWWRRSREWTISDGIRVMAWRAEQDRLREALIDGTTTSIPKTLLESRFGISASKAQLSSTLKGVLLGEVD